MDILAHGLWAGAAAQALRRAGRPVRVRAAVAWGVAPDLVAFGPLFAFLLLGLAQGGLTWAQFADPESMARPPWDGHPVFRLTSALYRLGHSAVIFAAVFAATWVWRGRPHWEMGGWGLHILLDIPTHARSFYPTPFLWPVSEWTFDGVSWAVPWALALNYAALAAAWAWLRRGRHVKAGEAG